MCVWLCAGGCKVMAAAEDSLTTAAGLLGVDREELRDSLISRVMQATRGGVKGTAIKWDVYHLVSFTLWFFFSLSFFLFIIILLLLHFSPHFINPLWEIWLPHLEAARAVVSSLTCVGDVLVLSYCGVMDCLLIFRPRQMKMFFFWFPTALRSFTCTTRRACLWNASHPHLMN